MIPLLHPQHSTLLMISSLPLIGAIVIFVYVLLVVTRSQDEMEQYRDNDYREEDDFPEGMEPFSLLTYTNSWLDRHGPLILRVAFFWVCLQILRACAPL